MLSINALLFLFLDELVKICCTQQFEDFKNLAETFFVQIRLCTVLDLNNVMT